MTKDNRSLTLRQIKRVIKCNLDITKSEHHVDNYEIGFANGSIAAYGFILQLLGDPCIDCEENTWCGGFVCKEAREYLGLDKEQEK